MSGFFVFVFKAFHHFEQAATFLVLADEQVAEKLGKSFQHKIAFKTLALISSKSNMAPRDPVAALQPAILK